MQAIVFLLDSVISFFCVLFLLRFMMQAMRVSFAGQPGNFVVALTNWAVKKDYLLPSNTKTMCSWKGEASYHTLFVDGDANPDAAWFYPDPKEAAAQIKGRVAFWKGVKVE